MDRAEPDSRLSRRSFVVLWLTVCVNMVGFGLILPVLPFHAERFGASAMEVTMLAAAFSVAQLISAPLLGRLSDRVGRRPVLLLSIAGSCVSMALLGGADSLALLFVARLISGACAANVPIAQAYVAARVGPEQRAAAMGRIGAAIGVGLVLGPAVGGLLSIPALPSLPFIVAAILAGINWVLAWLWLPALGVNKPPAASPASKRPRAPIIALVLINLGLFAAFAAMESTFALLVEARFGWGAGETGLVLALVGVVVVLSQAVVVGRVVARLGELTTMRLGLVALGLGLALIGLARTWVGLSLGACIVAFGNGLGLPALQAMISRQSDPGRRGADFGLATAAASLARILGPLGAGLAFERLGPGWPSLLGAVVALGIALATIHAALRPVDRAR